MRHTISARSTILVALTALALTACGDDDDKNDSAKLRQAVGTYANIVHASYQDSVTKAQHLQTLVTAFVATPAAESLASARNAWLAAREPYLQTEVYRFYDGPIDNPDDGPEGLINAWPLDEAYIDYVDGNAAAGIINDPSVAISAAGLESLNEQGGEENIATGFHAVEFLLWGQDLSAAGPGARPHTDYVTDGSGTAANQARRGQYLTTVTDMLVQHLQGLVSAWAPAASNYRAELESAAPNEGLRRILTGMIVLSGFETGGERLQAAYDSSEQEDEHSCFSDNTHRDMVQDIRGVQNVYRGSYTRLDGTTVTGVGVRDVVAEKDPGLAQRLDTEIAASLTLAEALQAPFDQEIAIANAAGRARVQALITALRAQERSLEEVFRAFALSVPVVEQ